MVLFYSWIHPHSFSSQIPLLTGLCVCCLFCVLSIYPSIRPSCCISLNFLLICYCFSFTISFAESQMLENENERVKVSSSYRFHMQFSIIYSHVSFFISFFSVVFTCPFSFFSSSLSCLSSTTTSSILLALRAHSYSFRFFTIRKSK